MTVAAESVRKENVLLRTIIAQKDEEIAKLRDTRDQFATQLDEYVQGNAHLQAELDRVMGEAVGFAGIIKSTRVWAADVEQAIQFLTNPLVQSWRARQGAQ